MTDNSIYSMMHQGKSLAQWAEAFKGEFTKDQLLKMIKGGTDLQKILMLGLDENEKLTPYEGLPGEQELMFEDEGQRSIKDYMMPNCQVRIFDDDGNEIFWSWVDPKDLVALIPYIGTGVCCDPNPKTNAVQAGAFLPNDDILRKYEGQTLTTFIYVDGEPLSLDHQQLMRQIRDVEARVDRVYKNAIVPAKIRRYNQEHALNEVSPEDEMAAFDESTSDVYVTVGDFKKALARNLAKDSDKIMFRVNKKAHEVFQMSGKGGTFVIDLIPELIDESIRPKWMVKAKVLGMTVGFTQPEETKEEAEKAVRDQIKKLSNGSNPKVEIIDIMPMNKLEEGYNWKTGGYGGYGRSYRSYGEVGAPRGKAISWFNVSELDPKASKLDADGWRAGPSNFPFADLLYPDRKYKVGTTVMRKNVKAGAESGNKYIAIPSYLDAIKNNDENAIGLLKALGIPLDLTFGYAPDEDFSSTYTIAAEV